MHKTIKSIVALGIILAAGAASAVPEDVIQKSFYPYKDWTPTFAGYKPGVVINQSNADQYKDILDEALYKFVKKGWVEIKTAPTTDFRLTKDYVEATRQHADGVTLNPNGTLSNYVAGRAFPEELDVNDPKSGQKLVWNYQYGFNSGDSESIEPFWWTYRNMKTSKVERTLKFSWHFMNYVHRVTFPPKPAFPDNPDKIFRGIYSRVLAPFDLKDTQLLIHRYIDDTKRDDAWLYLGFQRRVRRLATGQITDAFLGSDLMIEDFEGYNARVSDYNWKYAGTRNLLLPFYNHHEQKLAAVPENDPDGWHFIDVHGKGGCFPNVTYQLRKSYTLIGTPKDPNHPIGKRIINLDAQTMIMATLITYDRKGDMWKWFPIGKTSSENSIERNKGKHVAIDDFAVLIDMQAMHCTTLQFKSVITDDVNQPRLFSVQHMRKVGR